jgi:signal transduction histidine kinase
MRIEMKGNPFALTSFIPFPRAGGKDERRLAKLFPAKKIDRQSVVKLSKALNDFSLRFAEIEHSIASQQSMALHEIRKLNRTVKQNAERLFTQQSDLESSVRHQLESIWKASELMSSQFDVLELIANEDLARLPCSTLSEPYRVFDKLAKIYRHGSSDPGIRLVCPHDYTPRVYVCDKTFPILASVLLGNATKYCLQGTEIIVDFDRLANNQNQCRILITNQAKDHPKLDSRIFEKGYRVVHDSDGTGKGLYLAQLVARQHGSEIIFRKDKSEVNPSVVQCFFSIRLDEFVEHRSQRS